MTRPTDTLKKLLGIELPLIQAPMAGVQGAALAVAVSNAGGLGSLPCAMLGVDAMRKELAAIKAQTAKPFNVNFFCHQQPAPNAEREAASVIARSRRRLRGEAEANRRCSSLRGALATKQSHPDCFGPSVLAMTPRPRSGQAPPSRNTLISLKTRLLRCARNDRAFVCHHCEERCLL